MSNLNLAENFYLSWLRSIQKRSKELDEIWSDHSSFTSKIIGWEDTVVKDISKDLDLYVYCNNYYFIDCVFYKKEDLVDANSSNYNFKDLRIAFEHENNFNSGLYQEVSHLLLLNCDLKVLVSYPKNKATAQKELDFLHQIIKSNRKSNEISNNNEFLIIFNYEDNAEWEGLIFKNSNWKQINEKNTTGNSGYAPGGKSVFG